MRCQQRHWGAGAEDHATSAHDRWRKDSVTTDRSVAATLTRMPVLQYAQWLRDKAIDRIRRVLLGVLRAGPIPQHVAFVMDGNRRYARTRGMKVIQGHVDGFVALRRVRFHTHFITNA
jgi:hypothetical protein